MNVFLMRNSKLRLNGITGSINRKFSDFLKGNEKYRFLMTGCGGQIGTALAPKLIERFGEENVILTDISKKKGGNFPQGTFERLDVTDVAHYKYLMEKHQINYIIHLSGILSALGEKNPYLAMKVNGEGVINALDMAKDYGAKIFVPSTIAVFGPDVPKANVPNTIPLRPTTIYGVTKVFMENMGNYYHHKYKVDFRSMRYPGVISPYEYESHGTTDYASEIFFAAVKGQEYKIYLSPRVALPMAYLDDIIDGTVNFLLSDENLLTSRVYNVQGLSFSCEELGGEIVKQFPGFKYRYEPDFRDAIAKNWPASVDDSLAKADWKWNPKCKDVHSLVHTMKQNIKLTSSN